MLRRGVDRPLFFLGFLRLSRKRSVTEKVCSRNCAQTSWRKSQEKHLDTGRRMVTEAARRGLIGAGDDAETREILSGAAEFDA